MGRLIDFFFVWFASTQKIDGSRIRVGAVCILSHKRLCRLSARIALCLGYVVYHAASTVTRVIISPHSTNRNQHEQSATMHQHRTSNAYAIAVDCPSPPQHASAVPSICYLVEELLTV